MTAPAYLRPDLPAAYPFTVSAHPTVAKLDQNEAPVDLPTDLKAELVAELSSRPWNRYLQPAEYIEAKAALAEVVGVAPDQLAITSGGDNGLAAAAVVAGGPGRTIRWFEPTYPFIAHVARLSGARCEAVELGADIDSRLAPEHVGSPDLLYLVSPNNPTGGQLDPAVVDAALIEPRRLVVVDEAYFDFARHSVSHRLASADNLLIVRSLSKSLLAAVHVGYVLGSPEAIAAIERWLTAPYHLDWPQLLVCRRYRDIHPHVIEVAGMVRRERARVGEALTQMAGVRRVLRGEANFLAFEIAAEPATVAKRLAEAGVRVRDISRLPGMTGFLRVTIGTGEDNDRALFELARALG